MQVQEAQRVPNKMDTERPTPRDIISKMPKVKDKERILKEAREKKLVTYGGSYHKAVSRCPPKNFAGSPWLVWLSGLSAGL